MAKSAIKNIGILTGGGDCAGLNGVISSIVRAGVPMGYEFTGIIKGWEGILDPPMLKPLGLKDVRGISHLGGTIIRTTNRGRFAAKAGPEGGEAKLPIEILKMVERNMKKHKIDALIVIGGDGTLTGAHQLMEETGVKVVGVPKTIDNDLRGTDRTFGFSTAVEIVSEAVDRIHTTATSHDRVMFVETMGRHAGWIALYGGVAGNADAILLPEFPFSPEGVVKFLRERQAQGNHDGALVVVAEGARVGGKLSTREEGKASESKLGGIAEKLVHTVESLAPGEFEMRSVVLGHTQRGGSPNADDRILSRAYGVAAVEAVQRGDFGHMVSFRKGAMTTVPIIQAVGELHRVTGDDPVYKAARKIGIYLGD
ncbi:MAG: ATP-dependent 6-phosphofructokinase [Candidatus Peribacteraceae bacterium]|nr:ATP-dependent 6-phosphofructokinase [Candidatus Peribacteraceae bacterium]